MRKRAYRKRWSGLRRIFQSRVAVRKCGCRRRLDKMAPAAVAGIFRVKIPTLRVVSNGVNHGKGYSVRHGMQEAAGTHRAFHGRQTFPRRIEEAGKLIDCRWRRNDVAIGSRANGPQFDHRARVALPRISRESFLNKIVRSILWLPFVDTQCGFKGVPARTLRNHFSSSRPSSDLDSIRNLLFLARRHGLKAVEISGALGPFARPPKVSMLHDSISDVIDVFTIRWKSLKGRYPRKA